jgi:hypothetical protein
VTCSSAAGIIEDGVIENCVDLNHPHLDGAFLKLAATAWSDWKPGMKVRHSDSVVSNGRIYRVLGKWNEKGSPDGVVYTSLTAPNFEKGTQVIDGITWIMFQNEVLYSTFVRNLVVRDVFIHSDRTSFQFLCYDNDWTHSYYPGSEVPILSNIVLENVHMGKRNGNPMMLISAPIDQLTIRNSSFKDAYIVFKHSKDFEKYPPTHINIVNSTFTNPGKNVVIKNGSPGKEIFLQTSGNLVVPKDFAASVDAGPGTIHIKSDLPGLKNS